MAAYENDWLDWEETMENYPCWTLVHQRCYYDGTSLGPGVKWKPHYDTHTTTLLSCNALSRKSLGTLYNTDNCQIVWTQSCDVRENLSGSRAFGLEEGEKCTDRIYWK